MTTKKNRTDLPRVNLTFHGSHAIVSERALTKEQWEEQCAASELEGDTDPHVRLVAVPDRHPASIQVRIGRHAVQDKCPWEPADGFIVIYVSCDAIRAGLAEWK